MSNKKEEEEEIEFDESEVDYKIENVVATVTVKLEENITLTKIAEEYPEVEYNPERFPGLVNSFKQIV